MDIDVLRNQKLGAGAGIRSNKVRVCLCVYSWRTDCIMGGSCFFFLNIDSEALSPHVGFKPNSQECLFRSQGRMFVAFLPLSESLLMLPSELIGENNNLVLMA